MAKLMVQSAGALGMYCLGLRFEVSTRGRLPDDLSCSVEEVTDAQVKDFRDTSGVKQFVRTMGEALAAWTREAWAVPADSWESWAVPCTAGPASWPSEPGMGRT
jgi:hypothetical protein